MNSQIQYANQQTPQTRGLTSAVRHAFRTLPADPAGAGERRAPTRVHDQREDRCQKDEEYHARRADPAGAGMNHRSYGTALSSSRGPRGRGDEPQSALQTRCSFQRTPRARG